MLALAGFVGCLGCATAPFLPRRTREEPQPEPPDSQNSPAWTTVVPGVAAGFLLAVLAPLLSFTGGFDVWTVLLFCAWLVAFLLLSKQCESSGLSAAALGGAALGLCVNLLGAGGIEMPAVVQLFLVIAALAFAIVPGSADSNQLPKFVFGVGVAAVVLFVSCLFTATLPVFERREHSLPASRQF